MVWACLGCTVVCWLFWYVLTQLTFFTSSFFMSHSETSFEHLETDLCYCILSRLTVAHEGTAVKHRALILIVPSSAVISLSLCLADKLTLTFGKSFFSGVMSLVSVGMMPAFSSRCSQLFIFEFFVFHLWVMSLCICLCSCSVSFGTLLHTCIYVFYLSLSLALPTYVHMYIYICIHVYIVAYLCFFFSLSLIYRYTYTCILWQHTYVSLSLSIYICF